MVNGEYNYKPFMGRKKTPPRFEESLTELEQLIERLEEGDISLEDSLKTFERGVQLTRACQKALGEAEQKVQLLLEKEGEQQLQPFSTKDNNE